MQLKALINDKAISPDQNTDFKTWLKNWADFCMQAFAEGHLDDTFREMLDERIDLAPTSRTPH